ncbi:hypothetical protein TSAR_000555, partial [Trichomalopsis sarcophagae]
GVGQRDIQYSYSLDSRRGIAIAGLASTSLVGSVVVPDKEESRTSCRPCDFADSSRFSRSGLLSPLPRRPSGAGATGRRDPEQHQQHRQRGGERVRG